MNQRPIPRLVYVLPRYDQATGSHFFHLYELLEQAAAVLDIFVVVEKTGPEMFGFPLRAYRQRYSWPPLRALELALVLMRERMRGRRYFYTHYSFYGALASWLVTRIFGGTAYYWNAGMPWNYRRARLAEAAFRFILRHTVLVTGTVGLAAEYRRRYGLNPSRIRVLPNWVNVERFGNAGYNFDRKYIREKLNIPNDTAVVLFVHRLSRRKGAHLLPEIAAEVTKTRKDVIFLVVGDGPERESLKLKVKSLKLEPYVRMAGEVPHRELPAYYRAADVFLMPSEEEGFPHVLLEAMAAGVPYVASDVGGVSEITPSALAAFLVPNGDVAGFSERVSALLAKSPQERAVLAAVEQEWVQQYGIERVLPKFVEFFTE